MEISLPSSSAAIEIACLFPTDPSEIHSDNARVADIRPLCPLTRS